jgi:hypothetical protein
MKKIKEEKYKINTKKEERGIKKASKFFTALESRYDINSYLSKYAEYMLYNLTDNAFIQVDDLPPLLSLGKRQSYEKGNK